MTRTLKRSSDRWLFWLTLTATLGLVALFLIQYASLIRNSFYIQRFEERARSLSSTNEKMGVDYFNKSKLTNLDDIARRLEFERTEEVHYITSAEESVAAKIR